MWGGKRASAPQPGDLKGLGVPGHCCCYCSSPGSLGAFKLPLEHRAMCSNWFIGLFGEAGAWCDAFQAALRACGVCCGPGGTENQLSWSQPFHCPKYLAQRPGEAVGSPVLAFSSLSAIFSLFFKYYFNLLSTLIHCMKRFKIRGFFGL